MLEERRLSLASDRLLSSIYTEHHQAGNTLEQTVSITIWVFGNEEEPILTKWRPAFRSGGTFGRSVFCKFEMGLLKSFHRSSPSMQAGYRLLHHL